MSEDERLNAICEARKDGPFVQVRITDDSKLQQFMDGHWRCFMENGQAGIETHGKQIHTRHVGTIAFQGTDEQIQAMQRRTFGKEERT